MPAFLLLTCFLLSYNICDPDPQSTEHQNLPCPTQYENY